MELSELIKQRIHHEGPISFRDFMEMALYYPKLGYYMTDQDHIGSKGDFYTSCCLGPVFGAIIGKQLEEMWRLSGENEFTVVEFGAGTGDLCLNILDYFREYTGLYERLNYLIIEKSPPMQQKEKMHLPEKVNWYDTIEAAGNFTGCILSNELIDNFAVHQVVMQDELMEIFVDDRDGLMEVLRPAPPTLKNYFAALNIQLPKDYRTEVDLEATEWIGKVSRFLQKGYVMTIDYGYSADELYKKCRSQGTLLCYHKHQVNDNPYSNIGKQDITSHVNFSALCHWGYKSGLSCCGLTSQAHFLLALGFKDYLRKELSKNKDQNVVQLAMEEARLTHTLLIDMGGKFKVLIQQKDMPGPQLSGLSLNC